MSVIHIKFSTELPTDNQNKLRAAMEMARWKERWRIATEEKDYNTLDSLDRQYEMVGLP